MTDSRCHICGQPATTVIAPSRRWYCRAHADREQYVAMKVAEAWETWQDLVGETAPSIAQDWLAYKAGTQKLAEKMWERQQRREQKRARRTRSHEDLHEEPMDTKNPDPAEEAEAEDIAARVLDILEPTDSQVFDMLVSGCTQREISKELRLHKDSILRAVARIRMVLRSKISY